MWDPRGCVMRSRGPRRAVQRVRCLGAPARCRRPTGPHRSPHLPGSSSRLARPGASTHGPASRRPAGRRSPVGKKAGATRPLRSCTNEKLPVEGNRHRRNRRSGPRLRPWTRRRSRRRWRLGWSLSSFRSGPTCRSSGSPSTDGTTPRFDWATSCPYVSRAPTGTWRRSTRSTGGCRSWLATCPCRSRSRWPWASRAPDSRDRGRSIAGSRADRRVWSRSRT
jgi:hypothetical protein